MSEEVKIIKHMTGYPTNHRNFFATSPGGSDYETLIRMEAKGLVAKRIFTLDEMNESYVFHATEKGMDLLKLKGGPR